MTAVATSRTRRALHTTFHRNVCEYTRERSFAFVPLGDFPKVHLGHCARVKLSSTLVSKQYSSSSSGISPAPPNPDDITLRLDYGVSSRL